MNTRASPSPSSTTCIQACVQSVLRHKLNILYQILIRLPILAHLWSMYLPFPPKVHTKRESGNHSIRANFAAVRGPSACRNTVSAIRRARAAPWNVYARTARTRKDAGKLRKRRDLKGKRRKKRQERSLSRGQSS